MNLEQAFNRPQEVPQTEYPTLQKLAGEQFPLLQRAFTSAELTVHENHMKDWRPGYLKDVLAKAKEKLEGTQPKE